MRCFAKRGEGRNDNDEGQHSSSPNSSCKCCPSRIQNIFRYPLSTSIVLTFAVALSIFSTLDCQYLTVEVGFNPGNADLGGIDGGDWGGEGDSINIGLWSICNEEEGGPLGGRCYFVLDPYETLGFKKKIGRWGKLEKLTDVGADSGAGGLMVKGDSMWGVSRITSGIAAVFGLVSLCLSWLTAAGLTNPNPKIPAWLALIAFCLQAASIKLFFEMRMCSSAIWLDETKVSTIGRFLRRAESCKTNRGLIMSLTASMLYLFAVVIACQSQKVKQETKRDAAATSSPDYEVLGSVYDDEETGIVVSRDKDSKSAPNKCGSTATTASISEDFAQCQDGRYPSRVAVEEHEDGGAQLSFIEETSHSHGKRSNESSYSGSYGTKDTKEDCQRGYLQTSRMRITQLQPDGESVASRDRPRFVPSKCADEDFEPSVWMTESSQSRDSKREKRKEHRTNSSVASQDSQKPPRVDSCENLSHHQHDEGENRRPRYHRSRSVDQIQKPTKKRQPDHQNCQNNAGQQTHRHRSRSLDLVSPAPVPRQVSDPVSGSHTTLDDPMSFKKVNDGYDSRHHHQGSESIKRDLVMVSAPKPIQSSKPVSNEKTLYDPPPKHVNDDKRENAKQHLETTSHAIVPFSTTEPTDVTPLDDPNSFRQVSENQNSHHQHNRSESMERALVLVSGPRPTQASEPVSDARGPRDDPSMHASDEKEETGKQQSESMGQALVLFSASRNMDTSKPVFDDATPLDDPNSFRRVSDHQNSCHHQSEPMERALVLVSAPAATSAPAPIYDTQEHQTRAPQFIDRMDQHNEPKCNTQRLMLTDSNPALSSDLTPKQAPSSTSEIEQNLRNHNFKLKSLLAQADEPASIEKDQSQSMPQPTDRDRQHQHRSRSMDHVQAQPQTTPYQQYNAYEQTQSRPRSHSRSRSRSRSQPRSRSQSRSDRPIHRSRSMENIPTLSQEVPHQQPRRKSRSMDMVAPCLDASYQQDTGNQQRHLQHRRQSMDHVPAPSQNTLYQQDTGNQQRQPQHRTRSMDHVPAPSQNTSYQQDTGNQQRHPQYRRQSMDHVPAPAQDIYHQQDDGYQQRQPQHRTRSMDHAPTTFYQQDSINEQRQPQHRRRSMDHVPGTKYEPEKYSEQGLDHHPETSEFRPVTPQNICKSPRNKENETSQNPYHDQANKNFPTKKRILRPRPPPVIVGKCVPSKNNLADADPSLPHHREQQSQVERMPNLNNKPNKQNARNREPNPNISNQNPVRSKPTMNSTQPSKKVGNPTAEQDSNFLFNSPLGKGRTTIHAKQDWDDVSSLGTVEEVGIPKSKHKLK